MMSSTTIENIKLILSDVDGVLTNGAIGFDNKGIETKQFHIRDGLGIKMWQRAGFQFGVLTARTSHIVKVRCQELGIDIVRQGFENKLSATIELIKSLHLNLDQVCFVGDDLTDMPVISAVGLGVAVADAAPEVLAEADFVTQTSGGSGAVRELVEMILRKTDRWQGLVEQYYPCHLPEDQL